MRVLLWTALLGLAALPVLGFTANASSPVGSPWTTNNDDSCDIGVTPAATLLLPYFEIDGDSPRQQARTTLFTVTNVTASPQIARVTIWSDWSYPVLTFNVYLTGYDVQAINLRDVLVDGMIAPTSPTGERGERSASSNPHFLPTAAANCVNMPARVPELLLADARSALTTGKSAACGDRRVGGTHTWLIGFATVDVVADCTSLGHIDDGYLQSEMLFDNVLIGDYQIVDPVNASAHADPLVHVRAIPEGGAAGSYVPTNLPYTFYDRFNRRLQPRFDRRQPLPSAFAARYIQGGATGFTTDFVIWREGVTGTGAACSSYRANGMLEAAEFVRFDQRENPTSSAASWFIGMYWAPIITAPSTVRFSSSNTMFPPLTSGDTGGWMFMNLNAMLYADNIPLRARQNWVISSLGAEGRYSVGFTAAALGNGCSPPMYVPSGWSARIGPRP